MESSEISRMLSQLGLLARGAWGFAEHAGGGEDAGCIRAGADPELNSTSQHSTALDDGIPIERTRRLSVGQSAPLSARSRMGRGAWLAAPYLGLESSRRSESTKEDIVVVFGTGRSSAAEKGRPIALPLAGADQPAFLPQAKIWLAPASSCTTSSSPDLV
ncbi:hypothetical protein VTN00DRAFT_4817 [Thermoascus crustaceus]|uniref:uncharacterized protein n=1 Tax=Thermoascus crustaceus TaxID=5088 RepID=UPI003743BB47